VRKYCGSEEMGLDILMDLHVLSSAGYKKKVVFDMPSMSVGMDAHFTST
jgi:hypothetical protein